MANETTLTIIGNLTADPESRSTSSGRSVANFNVASTPRTYNKSTNQWDDGPALFMRCTAWGELADHVTASLHKGMRVIVSGRLSQRQYQAQDGSNRSVIELTVDEIGPSLKYATAQVTRIQRNNGAQTASWGAPVQSQGFAASAPQTGAPASNQTATDPWGRQ